MGKFNWTFFVVFITLSTCLFQHLFRCAKPDVHVLKLKAIRVAKANTTAANTTRTLPSLSPSPFPSSNVLANLTNLTEPKLAILSPPDADIVLVYQLDPLLTLPCLSPYLASFLPTVNDSSTSNSTNVTSLTSASSSSDVNNSSFFSKSLFESLFSINILSTNQHETNVSVQNQTAPAFSSNLTALPPFNLSLFRLQETVDEGFVRNEITRNVSFNPSKGVQFPNPSYQRSSDILFFVCQLQTQNQTLQQSFTVIPLTEQDVFLIQPQPNSAPVNGESSTTSNPFKSHRVKSTPLELGNVNTTLFQNHSDNHKSTLASVSFDSNDWPLFKSNSSEFRLIFANRSVTHAHAGHDIQLQCLLLTTRFAHSKNGFVWRKSSAARNWDYSRYQDHARDQKFVVSGNLKLDDLRLVQAKLLIRQVRRTDAGFHYCGYDTDRRKEYAGVFLQVHESHISQSAAADSSSSADTSGSLDDSQYCESDTESEDDDESNDIDSSENNNHDDDVSTELDHETNSKVHEKAEASIGSLNSNRPSAAKVNASRWWVRFQSEHSVDSPLVVKTRETFHIRIKVDFRCPGTYMYTWYYQMRPLDTGRPLISDRGGFSLAILHKVENADLKDAGDYTLVIQRMRNQTQSKSVMTTTFRSTSNHTIARRVRQTSAVQSQQLDNSISNGLANAPSISTNGSSVVRMSEDATAPASGVLTGNTDPATVSNKRTFGAPHMYTVLVRVRAAPELHTFKAEKFYVGNMYSLACHAYSGMQTRLYWQRCDSWAGKENGSAEGPGDCSTCIWQTTGDRTDNGNKESLFDINWDNRQQVGILDFQFNHDTCYICVAQNSLGTNNATVRISRSEVDLSISLNHTEVFEGDSIRISCEGIFHQPPTLQWIYQSVQPAPQSTLTDSKSSNRQAAGSASSISNDKLLDNNNGARSSPIMVASTTPSSIVLAEKSTKNYRIESSWQRSLLDELRTRTLARYVEYVRFRYMYTASSSLVIRQVQINQTGIYSCRNEVQPSQFTKIKLQVLPLQPPTILNLLRNDLRSKVILVCTYAGSPTPTVEWTRNGQSVNLTSVEQPFESKLLLQLNATDEDFYGCVVRSRLGSDQRNILVSVNYPSTDAPTSDPTKNTQNADQREPSINSNKSEGNIDDPTRSVLPLPPSKPRFPGNNDSGSSSRFNVKPPLSSTKYLIFGGLTAVACLIVLFALVKMTKKFGGVCFQSVTNRPISGRRAKSPSSFGFAFYNNSAGSDLSHVLPNLLGEDALALRSIEFPEERLELGRVLGQGAYGIVLKAEAIGIERSIKITTVAVKMPKEDQDQEQRKSLLSEVKILLFLGRHLNVVNLLGIVHKPRKLMVIVEYCRYGNLKNFLMANRSQFQNLVDETTGELATNRTDDSLPGDVSNSSKDSGFCVRNPLSTIDLINFAFQTCRGMQFIHSKRLLHRDLAARNVLLTHDYVVKICDFGLSKDVYLSDMYVKRGDGKLPIKWMAIESIVDQMFTMKSDVWSFAVLCWEVFSLGANPYPGIPIDEHFHRRLQNGYRMERSENCPLPVYELMNTCWQTDPQRRPNFEQLTTSFYELLDQSSHNSYVNVVGELTN